MELALDSGSETHPIRVIELCLILFCIPCLLTPGQGRVLEETFSSLVCCDERRGWEVQRMSSFGKSDRAAGEVEMLADARVVAVGKIQCEEEG